MVEPTIRFDASDPSNDPYNSPITFSNIMGMLKAKCTPNERPYVKSMMDSNNALLDKWQAEVLEKMFTSGSVPAGKVIDLWKVFEEGHEVRKMHVNMGKTVRASDAHVSECRDFLERSSMDDLYSAGMTYVMYAWKVVFDEIRIRVGLEKYDRVFYDENYLEWVNRASALPVLMTGQQLPFWNHEILADVSDKIATFTKVRIQPTKTPRQ